MKNALGYIKSFAGMLFPYKNAPVLNGANFVVAVCLPLKWMVDTEMKIHGCQHPDRVNTTYSYLARAACLAPIAATACRLDFGLTVGVTVLSFIANKVCAHKATELAV